MTSASDKRFPKNHSPESSTLRTNLLQLQSDLDKAREEIEDLEVVNRMLTKKLQTQSKQRGVETAKKEEVPLRRSTWDRLKAWYNK